MNTTPASAPSPLRALVEARGGFLVAVFSDHGEVLCVSCHGIGTETARLKREYWNQRDVVLEPEMLEPEEGLTTCDRCGEPVAIRQAIALEHRAAGILSRRGWTAYVEQMGGGCSAVQVALAIPEGGGWTGTVGLARDGDHWSVVETRWYDESLGGDLVPGYDGGDGWYGPSLHEALRQVERLLDAAETYRDGGRS